MQSNAIACLICSGTNLELYHDDAAERRLTSSDLGSSRVVISYGKIVRCGNCGFGFRVSRPSDAELADLYRELDPAVYERESAGRLRTAQRHLKLVTHFVPRGRVLDVGCASGMFLDLMADRGFEVVGVEPSKVLYEKAKSRLQGRGTILGCALQNAELAGTYFDLLTLWDVLEHVTEPLRFLGLCASLVRPGGYVVANVPDLETWQARLLGKRWPLLLAEHLNYFSRKSLTIAGTSSEMRAVRFGRRPSSFSLEYVLYRLAQHKVPGARLGHSVVSANALGSISIPAWLGESYVVWQKVQGSGEVA